jgi:sulfate/thiosulfate-binding protein
MSLRRFVWSAALGLALSSTLQAVEIINVSYDPTRELYDQYNKDFSRYWKQKSGQDVSIKNTHGGSTKQARSVIDGLAADVVTLGLAPDVDALVKHGGFVRADWQKQLPNNSAPYTSTIVLVVRKGNPKAIKDWGDLSKPGVAIITPNPKTSAGARWNYLAAWEYGKRHYNGDAGAKDFVTKIYGNVPVLDSGARGSVITFTQRGVGDVLLAWENEAFLIQKEFGADKFEIVVPSVSIKTEPTVAVVDKNVDRKGTRSVATEDLQHLYSDEAQDLIGKNFYRPSGKAAAAKYAAQFPKLELFTIDSAFGSWAQANKAHFDDGASFDQIYVKK